MDIDVYEVLFKRKESTGYVFTDERGQPFDSFVLRLRLGHVQRRADMRRFGWHTFRHTFASHLVMRGVPLRRSAASTAARTVYCDGERTVAGNGEGVRARRRV